MLESGIATIIRRRAGTFVDASAAGEPPARQAEREARPEVINRYAQAPGPAVILPRRLSFLAPPRRVEPTWPGTRGQLA